MALLPCVLIVLASALPELPGCLNLHQSACFDGGISLLCWLWLSTDDNNGGSIHVPLHGSGHMRGIGIIQVQLLEMDSAAMVATM